MTTTPSVTGLITEASGAAIPLAIVRAGEYAGFAAGIKPHVQTWLKSVHFGGKPGQYALLPGEGGAFSGVLAVISDRDDPWAFSHLPAGLPEGQYRIERLPKGADVNALAVGWGLGCYQFSRYKKPKRLASLAMPREADASRVQAFTGAIGMARNLINTPASDLHTEALADAAAELAGRYGAACHILKGKQLTEENFPAIYSVGKGSIHPPCLADLRWGREDAPKVTLVGKGVCFDTGGLDIKSSANMRLMKKDMGGAAVCMALAMLVMEQKLDISLRVLLPIVENAVSATAMRPGDVLSTRKGVTVEVGNTDAEGRLILADALWEAASETPDLLIDCATLTGAARAALGPELPAFFTPDDALAEELVRHSAAQTDPLYRLPLWENYRSLLDSKVADLSNDPESPLGGAITAALFLREFTNSHPSWLHIDMMAWNTRALPGRPIGGEAQGVRALFALLEARYG